MKGDQKVLLLPTLFLLQQHVYELEKNQLKCRLGSENLFFVFLKKNKEEGRKTVNFHLSFLKRKAMMRFLVDDFVRLLALAPKVELLPLVNALFGNKIWRWGRRKKEEKRVASSFVFAQSTIRGLRSKQLSRGQKFWKIFF